MLFPLRLSPHPMVGVRGLDFLFTLRLADRVPAIKSLHLPCILRGAWLGSGLPPLQEASPNLTDYTSRFSPRAAHCVINSHASRYEAEIGFR